MTRAGNENAQSGWRPLSGWTPSPDVLRETLDGGQSFRWQVHDGVWVGTWSTHVVELRRTGDSLEWRGSPGLGEADLQRYLGGDRDWSALADALPWRSDPHLAVCLSAFPGLRILRQPFGETLLGFLCSATKQIFQIKQMVALLAERHGAKLPPHSALRTLPSASVHRLPTWQELAALPEKELRLPARVPGPVHRGDGRVSRRTPRLAG
jgi:N-glycosylase/DNA lyase